jgi:nucleolar protein 14
MRIAATTKWTGDVPELTLNDCRALGRDTLSRKLAIMSTTLQILDAAIDTWSGKPSFYETFSPVLHVLQHLTSKPNAVSLPTAVTSLISKLLSKTTHALRVAELARRPLELHHHRPVAIKQLVPRFEAEYDPGRHYDPDRERAELAKLKAEHKKERKGAMRELRKDANFMARENLKLKKARDEAYEKKYKRLVAEIQGEEGREANAYEREKSARKRKFKR